jgi:rhamnosyltransferase
MGSILITIRRNDFNHGGTRNIAAEAASGEYIVFLTQDVLPVNEKLIFNLIKPMMDDADIAITYGRQIAYPSARPLERFIREFNYPAESRKKSKTDIYELGVKTFFCSNACAAYRKTVFCELGGFLPNTIMNEDMEYVYRAVMQGHSLYYASEATVWHSHDYSFMQQLGRYVDIGVFFTENPDLKARSKNESEGVKYILAACRYLIKTKNYFEFLHLITDTLARFSGYRIGAHYKSLPIKLAKRLSMNRGFWKE